MSSPGTGVGGRPLTTYTLSESLGMHRTRSVPSARCPLWARVSTLECAGRDSGPSELKPCVDAGCQAGFQSLCIPLRPDAGPGHDIGHTQRDGRARPIAALSTTSSSHHGCHLSTGPKTRPNRSDDTCRASSVPSLRRGQAGQVADQSREHARESRRACIIMYYYVRESASECVGCILARCPDRLLGSARLYPTNVQTMSNAEFPLRLTLCSNAECSSSYV